MPASENHRLIYKDKFRSLHSQRFQLWFEELARALHPEGEFQPIRNTRGDGGLDGFAINGQRVYQVYAPARFQDLRDSQTARKIRGDFKAAFLTLGGQLKSWVFVHNHPEAKIGQLTASALSELKAQHPAITFTVLDIDSLWQTLQTLSDDVLKVLFDSGSPEELPARMADEILDLRQELSTGNAKTQDAINKLPRDIEFQVNNAVSSAMAESYQEAEHLKSINQ